MIGSPFGDTIIGNDHANNLQGGAGNDQLSGGTGADVIDGGLGIDTLIESRDVNYTLTNTQLIATGTGIVGSEVDTLASIEFARLTGGANTTPSTPAASTRSCRALRLPCSITARARTSPRTISRSR